MSSPQVSTKPIVIYRKCYFVVPKCVQSIFIGVKHHGNQQPHPLNRWKDDIFATDRGKEFHTELLLRRNEELRNVSQI